MCSITDRLFAEQIQLAGPTGHEQEYDGFSFGRVVSGLSQVGPSFSLKQRTQRHRTHADSGLLQEVSSTYAHRQSAFYETFTLEL